MNIGNVVGKLGFTHVPNTSMVLDHAKKSIIILVMLSLSMMVHIFTKARYEIINQDKILTIGLMHIG